jgi:hypothetical protein
MSTMKRYTALIKRELVEHRRSVLYAAPIMAIVLFLLMLAGGIWNGIFQVNAQNFSAQALAAIILKGGAPALTLYHQIWMFSIYALFHGVAGVVMFSYSLSCLFDERKDRSTLFWRSLPVRDWETVAAKSFMLLVVIPLIYMFTLMLLQMLLVLLLTVLCWAQNLDASDLIFSVIPFGKVQLWQLASQMLTSLWVLPVFAWCLFCSSYAKQRPFLFATLIPASLIAMLAVVNVKNFVGTFNGTGPAGLVSEQTFYRALAVVRPDLGVKFNFEKAMQSGLDFGPLLDRLMSLPMLFGVIVGFILLAATAYVRRYREDAAA